MLLRNQNICIYTFTSCKLWRNHVTLVVNKKVWASFLSDMFSCIIKHETSYLCTCPKLILYFIHSISFVQIFIRVVRKLIIIYSMNDIMVGDISKQVSYVWKKKYKNLMLNHVVQISKQKYCLLSWSYQKISSSTFEVALLQYFFRFSHITKSKHVITWHDNLYHKYLLYSCNPKIQFML